MKLFFARTAYSAKSLLWISPFASYSSFVLYVKSVLPLFKIDKIDRYHHQGMSCPEVVYQAYYPYLYQRPPPVSSTATSSSANGHRNAHFSPFAAAAHHHHHHQYDRVRRYNFFFLFLPYPLYLNYFVLKRSLDLHLTILVYGRICGAKLSCDTDRFSCFWILYYTH